MSLKLLLLATIVTLTSATCDLPPRFWCDSKSIAKNCGVELQCAEQFWVEEQDVKPVMLDLYFESLCPDCQEFIDTMLYPTWRDFRDTGIVKLTTFPYGNAHETKDSSGSWNYTCQHGPDECTGNLIENCIQKYTNYDVNKYFPIFFCIESSEGPLEAAEICVTNAGLKWADIHTCAMGPEGNALMHKSAEATEKLDPPHKYVPWVTINGEHTESLQQEAQKDLAKLLCDTYKGVKPSQCKASMKEPRIEHVTYRDD